MLGMRPGSGDQGMYPGWTYSLANWRSLVSRSETRDDLRRRPSAPE
jgi:hypothetical protein